MGTQVWKTEAVLKEKISTNMPIQYMTYQENSDPWNLQIEVSYLVTLESGIRDEMTI